MTQGRCNQCHTRWVWWREVSLKELRKLGLAGCPRYACQRMHGIPEMTRTTQLCKDPKQVHPYKWLWKDHTEAEILAQP